MFGILENKWLHIQGYYYKKYMNFTMELHKHNRLELMYCANGSFTFEYLDEESERNQVIVEQNCFILIKPDIPHRLLVTDGYAIIMNLEFDIETASNNYFNFSNLLRNMPPPPRKTDYTVGSDNGNVKNLLNIIFSSCSPITRPPDIYINSLIYSLFYNILHMISPSEQNYFTGYRYLKKALLYIHRNLNKPLTLETIAENAGISPTYLKKLFRTSYQTSVNQYIISQRLKKAKNLLINTTSSVNEIAASCGYLSRHGLEKIFKQHERLSPNTFRKTYSSNEYVYSSTAHHTILHETDDGQFELQDE